MEAKISKLFDLVYGEYEDEIVEDNSLLNARLIEDGYDSKILTSYNELEKMIPCVLIPNEGGDLWGVSLKSDMPDKEDFDEDVQCFGSVIAVKF